MKLDAPAWLEAARILREFAPTGDTGKDGFHVARVLHGALGRHDINPHTIPSMSAGKRAMRLLRDNCPYATHGIPEVVADSWGNVMVPDGWHPVAWAVRRFRWLRKPALISGDYITKAQHELATCLYHVLSFLPRKKGEVFASLRQLEAHIGVQKDVIAATLNLMNDQGTIARVYKGKGRVASRYKLPCFQTEASDAIDAMGKSTLSLHSAPAGSSVQDEIQHDLDAMFGPKVS